MAQRWDLAHFIEVFFVGQGVLLGSGTVAAP